MHYGFAMIASAPVALAVFVTALLFAGQIDLSQLGRVVFEIAEISAALATG